LHHQNGGKGKSISCLLLYRFSDIISPGRRLFQNVFGTRQAGTPQDDPAGYHPGNITLLLSRPGFIESGASKPIESNCNRYTNSLSTADGYAYDTTICDSFPYTHAIINMDGYIVSNTQFYIYRNTNCINDTYIYRYD
jgi:hypothetical protein